MKRKILGAVFCSSAGCVFDMPVLDRISSESESQNGRRACRLKGGMVGKKGKGGNTLRKSIQEVEEYES
jgi:hypothetical protein